MALEPQAPEPIPPQPAPPQEGVVSPTDADTLPTVVVEETPPPPYGRTWAFDITAEQFTRIGAHGPRDLRGAMTLVQWIDKALHTTRGALPIHPEGYGMDDPFSIFGRPVTELSQQELARKISDCLTFHPRIAAVVDVALYRDPQLEEAYCTFRVQTDPPLDDADLITIRLNLGNIL